ncbi:MAG TPA: hypothetical protein VFQ43_01300 [Nitrososphaera sp.]|nr:hypothetical protein [Nitrososphaera sp.]
MKLAHTTTSTYLMQSSVSCGLTHDGNHRETCGKGSRDDTKPTNIQIQLEPTPEWEIDGRAPNGWLDRDIGVAGTATTTNKQTWLPVRKSRHDGIPMQSTL